MKDKLINFLLIFLLVLLSVNLFFGNGKENNTLSNTVTLKTENSYTIPASVKLTVTNNTLEDISFNTCKDLTIKKDSNIITPNECNIVKLKPTGVYIQDFSKEYNKFFDVGEYFAVLKLGDQNDIITKFQVETKGFISKFFIFFFYAPIYNLMAFLLEITNFSLGWSIIIITLILRIILLYPQHKMMISQKKLQLLQPKIKDLQEKYKGNSQMLGMEMLKLYKEEKVNPFASFGLLFIQMPILIVIYHVILSIQDYSNMYYLYSFVGDYSVSLIDRMFFGVDLLGAGGIKGLILAVIVGLLQYLQVKLSISYNKKNAPVNGVVLEKKKDSNSYENFMPDPELMNKVMLYGLPVMIGIATYSFFIGVGVYWGIGTLFMIVQQLIVNKIIKK